MTEVSDETMIRECAEVTGVLDEFQANLIDGLYKHHIDNGRSISTAQRVKLKEAYQAVCESDQ